MHAGLYVLALVNTNECAQFSTRITDVNVCRAAALVLGRTFSVSGTFVSAPRGCYVITSTGAVWFNAHATGAAAADKQLVCYTGTPAPTNAGDTNPPTRAPTTFAPTRGPNFADPTGTGECDRHDRIRFPRSALMPIRPLRSPPRAMGEPAPLRAAPRTACIAVRVAVRRTHTRRPRAGG